MTRPAWTSVTPVLDDGGRCLVDPPTVDTSLPPPCPDALLDDVVDPPTVPVPVVPPARDGRLPGGAPARAGPAPPGHGWSLGPRGRLAVAVLCGALFAVGFVLAVWDTRERAAAGGGADPSRLLPSPTWSRATASDLAPAHLPASAARSMAGPTPPVRRTGPGATVLPRGGTQPGNGRAETEPPRSAGPSTPAVAGPPGPTARQSTPTPASPGPTPRQSPRPTGSRTEPPPAAGGPSVTPGGPAGTDPPPSSTAGEPAASPPGATPASSQE